MESKFRIVRVFVLFSTINVQVPRVFYLFRVSILSPMRRLAAKFSLRRFYRRVRFRISIQSLTASILRESNLIDIQEADLISEKVRVLVRKCAGLTPFKDDREHIDVLKKEIFVLIENSDHIRPIFEKIRSRRVLYTGQCYYNSFYLSRSLRRIDWKADLIDWDQNEESKKFYHGSDIDFNEHGKDNVEFQVNFYLDAIYKYDLYHFSNSRGITFGLAESWYAENFGAHSEIYLLKSLGKKIVYTNNGCQDGVRKSSFSKWGPHSPCSDCVWVNNEEVCSDRRNYQWGEFRNSVADFQCLLGGNRIDFNVSPKVHEVPEYYCLSPDVWNPNMRIPSSYQLPSRRSGEVRVYHAVGNFNLRTSTGGVNIKSTHIYLPLIERLRSKGLDIELVSPDGVPNLDVRYLQLQSDIFLEMLTYGWFGANAREAMMLGKPVVCFIRPEWLESLRREIPEYAEELPVVTASPETVEAVLEELVRDETLRSEIGARSRAFALKWHSDNAGAARFERIYSDLLLEREQSR